jgi:prevent-host-death family protein
MIDLQDIHPLTDFKQHSGKYAELLRTKQSPIVLTVNGKAAFVLQDAQTFKAIQERFDLLEKENRKLKEQAFQSAVMAGVEQVERGEMSARSIDDIFGAALNRVKAED